MIAAAMENLIAGYLWPRASVRRMLDAGHGLDVALMMVALAYLVGAIFTVLIPGTRPEMATLSVSLHVLGLLLQVLLFFIASTIVYRVGRFFGGSGSRQETFVAMAWYTLVTSIIAPMTVPARIHVTEMVNVAAEGEMTPVPMPFPALAMFTFASGIMLWLFACYVAELHRFARTWNVLAVILGLSAALSAAFMALMPSV